MLEDIIARMRDLRDAHNAVIADVESARTRVVTVESLSEQLGELPAQRARFLRTAIGCAEHGFNRPAIVMAWAALFDRVIEILDSDDFSRLNALPNKWKPVKSRDELVENHSELQIVDAFGNAKFVNKTQRKTLQAQLHMRNRAAHAGPWNPSFNVTLGYLEDVIDTLADLA